MNDRQVCSGTRVLSEFRDKEYGLASDPFRILLPEGIKFIYFICPWDHPLSENVGWESIATAEEISDLWTAFRLPCYVYPLFHLTYAERYFNRERLICGTSLMELKEIGELCALS